MYFASGLRSGSLVGLYKIFVHSKAFLHYLGLTRYYLFSRTIRATY